MDCIPLRTLFTGNPFSVLLFTCVTYSNGDRGGSSLTAGLNRRVPHDLANLCYLREQGRMLFRTEHLGVEASQPEGGPCNLNVLWPLCCGPPQL